MTIIFYVLGAVLAELTVAVFVGKLLRAGNGGELATIPIERERMHSQEFEPAARAEEYALRSMEY